MGLPLGISHVADDGPNTVVGWIDAISLSRECMIEAVVSAQRAFLIMPFDVVDDCIKAADRRIDLLVYHAHEKDSVNVVDILALRQAFMSTALVILSDATNLKSTVVKGLLTAGASGLILTNLMGRDLLIRAFALAVSGGTFIPKEFLLSDNFTEKPSIEKQVQEKRLSVREIEVLTMLRQGMSNKIIAEKLNRSEATVKVHVRNLMRKMGSTSRTHAAYNADRFIIPSST